MSDRRFGNFGGNSPIGIVGGLLDPNRTKEGYPLDVIERAESAPPYSPVAHADKATNQYEVYAFASWLQSADPSQGGGTIGVGGTRIVRATFTPERWKVYFVATAAGQILWATPGPDSNGPSEFCMNSSATGKSDTLNIPGRSNELSLRADAANTAPLTVVVVAMRNAGDLG